MEINITYKSPEHEAAFLSELQRIPHIVNPESGRVNPYWGASLYLLSALTRWPELRVAVIGEDYMMFTAAKEAFNLSQNERIIVELAAAFYNAGLWEMPGFEMVCATCDTAFALILEAFRQRCVLFFFFFVLQRWGGVRRMGRKKMRLRRAVAILRLVAADDLSSGRAIDGQNEAAAVVREDYEETKKELADWVNASPEELADVIAGM